MMLTIKTNPVALAVLVLATGAATFSTASIARDKSNPNWPCVQRKIDNLAVGQFWDGPSIEGIKGWWSDKPTMTLINTLAARRTTNEDAEKAIKEFAAAQSGEKHDQALTLVFAGLFDKMSGTRRGILSGIERYYKAQETRSLSIEKMGSDLVKLEHAAENDEAAKAKHLKAKENYEWAARIFQERQSNMPLACEVPVLIDQHLFQMSRLVRQSMND